MFKIEGDRREHQRYEIQQPCKIFDCRSGKYISGVTHNLSAQGMLIEIKQVTGFNPGDRMHVGVAMKRRQGILQAKEMIEAVVVRAMVTADDRTFLGVRFDAGAVEQQHERVAA